MNGFSAQSRDRLKSFGRRLDRGSDRHAVFVTMSRRIGIA
jgi:hypothetical protein